MTLRVPLSQVRRGVMKNRETSYEVVLPHVNSRKKCEVADRHQKVEYFLVNGFIETSRPIENLLSLMISKCLIGIWRRGSFIGSYKFGQCLCLEMISKPYLSVLERRWMQVDSKFDRRSIGEISRLNDLFDCLRRNGFYFQVRRIVPTVPLAHIFSGRRLGPSINGIPEEKYFSSNGSVFGCGREEDAC